MRTKTSTVRTCLYFNECAKKEIHDGIKWKEGWCTYQGQYCCFKHYNRYKSSLRTKQQIKKANDKRPKSRIKKYNDRRITFLGKKFYLKWKIRTGLCVICGMIGKKTDMHHLFYVPIMVWCCTQERCTSCHNIETNKYIMKNGLTKGYRERLQVV